MATLEDIKLVVVGDAMDVHKVGQLKTALCFLFANPEYDLEGYNERIPFGNTNSTQQTSTTVTKINADASWISGGAAPTEIRSRPYDLNLWNTAGQEEFDRLRPYCDELCEVGSRVSLFIEPDLSQIESAAKLGVPVIEHHAGAYCDANEEQKLFELEKILKAAACADDLGLECHVGHGLNFENVTPIASIKSVVELNIGHFIIGEAVFLGLTSCIQKMRALMNEARNIK